MGSERETQPANERVAVLEHRADSTDEAIREIRGFAAEIRDSNAQLVKVVTNQEHMQSQLNRLEDRIDDEREKRLTQHDQTREWAKDNQGQLSANSAWREWTGKLLIAGVGGLITLAGAMGLKLIGG